jgi:lactoylglutathione lyase
VRWISCGNFLLCFQRPPKQALPNDRFDENRLGLEGGRMPAILNAFINIYSADIAGAAGFYGRVLGFEETYRFPRDGEPEHVEFRVGSATIAVSSPAGLRTHGMPPATPGHSFEVCLETGDVDATVKELRAGGVTIIKEPSVSPAGIRYAYIADPDGTWISIYQGQSNDQDEPRGAAIPVEGQP